MRAKTIRERLTHPKDVLTGTIQCGSAAYDAGCIFYKEYHLESIPGDELLFEDLNEFMDLYRDYYDVFVAKTESSKPEVEKEGAEVVCDFNIKDKLEEIKRYIWNVYHKPNHREDRQYYGE